MKPIKLTVPLYAIFICIVFSNPINAQESWASWPQEIPTKGYEGHRFKLTARVKIEAIDDSASAMLWARVDKAQGTGFLVFYFFLSV
ncbi:MAG: hypothetical protein H0V14_11805 [Chitinophagaceae bacterium]|nr:hypothetical protein [Chitinophagaceae bacterium]